MNLSSSMALRFSAGYGFTREENRFTGSFSSDSAFSNNYSAGVRFTTAGMPIEGAIIFQLPVDGARRLGFHFGIGGGFYWYTTKIEAFQQREGNFDPPFQRDNVQAPEAKLTGPAQFFLLGFDFRINSKLCGHLEMSKLGFSWLKEKKEDQYELPIIIDDPFFYEDKYEENHNAGSGLRDVALSLGISMNLKK